jgi:hypothetical protein
MIPRLNIFFTQSSQRLEFSGQAVGEARGLARCNDLLGDSGLSEQGCEFFFRSSLHVEDKAIISFRALFSGSLERTRDVFRLRFIRLLSGVRVGRSNERLEPTVRHPFSIKT